MNSLNLRTAGLVITLLKSTLPSFAADDTKLIEALLPQSAEVVPARIAELAKAPGLEDFKASIIATMKSDPQKAEYLIPAQLDFQSARNFNLVNDFLDNHGIPVSTFVTDGKRTGKSIIANELNVDSSSLSQDDKERISQIITRCVHSANTWNRKSGSEDDFLRPSDAALKILGQTLSNPSRLAKFLADSAVVIESLDKLEFLRSCLQVQNGDATN